MGNSAYRRDIVSHRTFYDLLEPIAARVPVGESWGWRRLELS